MLARGRDDTHKNVVAYALEAASSERASSLSSLTLLHMLFFYVVFVVRRVRCFLQKYVRDRPYSSSTSLRTLFFFKYVRDRPY